MQRLFGCEKKKKMLLQYSLPYHHNLMYFHDIHDILKKH